jgi:membrane-associated phospholipid phosphatase
MHVTGVRHARNTGRRGTPVLRADGDRFVPHGASAGRAGARLRRAARHLAGWRRVARELVLVAVFLAVYEEIRWNMVQAGGAAASHALSIVSAEKALGLFHERAVQEVFTRWDTVTDAFNTYYGGTHFLVPAAALAWLLLRHPEQYARARTALALTTAAGFACFWLYPVAPPRLLPAGFGFVDTLRAGGSGHLETSLINTAGDQYASMPSLHVAWAVWCALALYPAVRHLALRVLVVAYPVTTTLVVVATGNHFFLDAVAGTILACLTWASVSPVTRPLWRAGHRRAAEAATGHAGTRGAGLDGGLDRLVGLGPGHPEVVTQRAVRGGQQLAYCGLVAGPQQLGGPQNAAVLRDDVPGYPPEGRLGQPGQRPGVAGDVAQRPDAQR